MTDQVVNHRLFGIVLGAILITALVLNALSY